MDTLIKETLSSLRSRHINGFSAENNEEAIQKILSLIPKDAVVGIGDSTAVRQLGLTQVLKDRGSKVLNPFVLRESYMDPMEYSHWRQKIQKEATVCDVFLTGTNAITQDGRIVNVDAVGNRVAGMFWGHPTSIIVIGRNKIVKNLDEAFHRIRKIIAPNHLRIRAAELGGRGRTTPCAVTGECSDCRTIDRICNIFSIIEGKPYQTDITVVIVNQDLGLGWDPSWPQDRIGKILENYKKFVWVPPSIV
jgi:hypothetical protein